MSYPKLWATDNTTKFFSPEVLVSDGLFGGFLLSFPLI
jgi:hypothetical protein